MQRRVNHHSKAGQKKSYKKAPKIDRKPKAEEIEVEKPQVWGLHAFRQAWLNPQRHIKEAWLSPAAAKDLEETLSATLDTYRPAPKIMAPDQFKDVFIERDTVHQGACLWGEALIQPTFDDWLKDEPKRVVILDHVTDPHNVGAILRSACAFGFDGVIMQDRHAPSVTGTLAKIASGAVEHTAIISVVNLARAIEQLKESGFFAIGLAEEESVSFDALPSYEKLMLVMGAEGDGLRDGVRKACDVCVALPTNGAIKSLNVSAAASAAMMGISAKSK